MSATARAFKEPDMLPDSADQQTMGPNSPRKPWLAVLLSAMLPGLGQIYVGELNRGIWVFLLFTGLTVSVPLVAALYLPAWAMFPTLALGLIANVAIWFFALFDAWRTSCRLKYYKPKPWQTSALYVSVFLICNVVLMPIFISYVRQHQVQPFRIPSASMSPTLLKGDYLFADMRYNCPTCATEVKRGDMVIFVFPNNRNRYHIKRIIGLPGDRINTGDIPTRVEGADTKESVLTVPVGHVYLLGDNYQNSLDSRHFGTVPLTDIVGKARQLWFSYGDEGIRWNRLGKRL